MQRFFEFFKRKNYGALWSNLLNRFYLSLNNMIHLNNIKPIPLIETPGGISPASDTFGQQLTFQRHKKYLVIAPSGKGKSTLLHIIYGLRNDFEGNLVIDEKPVANFEYDDWSELRQDKLSIIFQDLRLFPALTAMENIQLKANLKNFKTEAEIKKMAIQLEVEHLLEKQAKTLSYGQRQRVAIIRALCQPFDFLLLDEPFSHLDALNVKVASDLIETEVNKQKSGLILVSLEEKYHFSYDQELLL
ncbi:MAG: putative ABC transport system ATP-binding protein [Paraglaciecola sp.]|jgi:putative ABC transport system ATP-binding protein